MKTKRLYALAIHTPRQSLFHSKLFIAAIILAILASLIPAARVFAAPAIAVEDNNLEEEWSDKLDQLRVQGKFYEELRLFPADFDDPADLAQARYYLDKYALALRQANTVVFNHAGFDLEGNVTHEKLADQSVHDLAMYLHMMRGLREKMDEVRP